MNIVLHNLKKDLRKLRILLVFWFVLLAMHFSLVATGFKLMESDLTLQTIFNMIAMVLPFLQNIVLIILVPLLILEEPLVGTTAFWFTRPLSRKDLLKSKTLFIVLFLLLPPLLAEVVILAVNNASAIQMGYAIPEIILDRSYTIFIAAGFAVISRNFARYALTGVLFMLAFWLFGLGLQAYRMYFDTNFFIFWRENESLLWISREIFTKILIFVGGIGLVGYQYTTRRTRNTLSAAVTVACLSFGISAFWPIDFFEGRLKKVQVDTDGFEIEALVMPSAMHVSDDFSMANGKVARKLIYGRAEFSGGPENVVISPLSVISTLTLNGGQVIETKDAVGHTYPQLDWDYRALKSVFDDYRILDAQRLGQKDVVLAKVDVTTYMEENQKAGKLEGEIKTKILVYEIVDEMPLKVGESIGDGVLKTAISRVLRNENGCVVILRQRWLDLLFDPRTTSQPLYVLKNSDQEEIYLPNDDDRNFGNYSNDGRLQFATFNVDFTPQNYGMSRARIDEEWMDNAVLVKLVAVKQGELDLPFSIDNFKMKTTGRGYPSKNFAADKKANRTALDKVVLAENASREETEKYIKKLMSRGRNVNSWSVRDPEVKKYMKVGPDNLDLLVSYAGGARFGGNFHVKYAVEKMIRKQHKAFVLSNLEDYPWLVKGVKRFHWEEEARDTILEVLSQQPTYLPTEWIQIAAGYKDPETYDMLRDYFVEGGSASRTYKDLKKLKDFPLDEAVASAWERVKYDHEYAKYSMVPIAIKHGHLDALEIGVVDILIDEEGQDHNRGEVRKVLKKMMKWDDEGSFISWYQKNKENLVFDKDKNEFVVMKSQ